MPLYTTTTFDPPETPDAEPQPEDTPEVETTRTSTIPARLVYDTEG